MKSTQADRQLSLLLSRAGAVGSMQQREHLLQGFLATEDFWSVAEKYESEPLHVLLPCAILLCPSSCTWCQQMGNALQCLWLQIQRCKCRNSAQVLLPRCPCCALPPQHPQAHRG